MDEQTEELRDIFMNVSDEDTVTESQEADRGSLTGGDDADRINAVIEQMREQYEFATDLDTDTLETVVRGYFDARSDGDLADELDVSRDAVARARFDMHLLRDGDRDAPFDLDELRGLADASTAEAATTLDVSESTVRRYRRVLAAEAESRHVSKRFYSAFADAIPDAELSDSMTQEAVEDGLDDATDGMETNVSF
ncbi:MAG: conditioned medium-induced protein 4 [Halobacteriales archaeon]|nr:conditioned medium-induced protein 4 [Halobacteriales archaeon]